MTDNRRTGDLEARMARALADRERDVGAALRGDDARASDGAFVETMRAQLVGEAPQLVAVGADEARGPRRVGGRRWMQMAAAAAVLVGAVVIGSQMGSDRDRGVTPVDGQGTERIYMGEDGEGGTVRWNDGVDWSNEPEFATPYDIVVRDPSKIGGEAVIYEDFGLRETIWPCPPNLKKQLPATFVVELYVGNEREPRASRLYSQQ